jgi:hypothetical protein
MFGKSRSKMKTRTVDAASSTVEALMYELREFGLAALAGPNCRGRLADLSSVQLREVIARLIRLRPNYPAFNGEPPTGADMLETVHDFLGRFVAYPSPQARIAHTLWIVHTHAMEAWESTPRIAFLSPEPGSGKTRALEISEMLVPRPVEAINVTPAYLFRKVADPNGLPTILFDEIDTIFGPKAKDNEEIRGLLNAGHRRGAVAGRCVVKGKIIETEEIPAYCAVALAGIGDLPDTILSRSVIIKMHRRAPDEPIEPYRRRVHAPEGAALRQRIAAWAAWTVDSLDKARPEPPEAELWGKICGRARLTEAARVDMLERAMENRCMARRCSEIVRDEGLMIAGRFPNTLVEHPLIRAGLAYERKYLQYLRALGLDRFEVER